MTDIQPNQSGKGMRITLKDPGAIDQWVKFCLTLQQRRLELGVSRPEMAQRLGVALPVFSKWERGDRCPHPYDLVRWLNELGFVLAVDEKE